MSLQTLFFLSFLSWFSAIASIPTAEVPEFHFEELRIALSRLNSQSPVLMEEAERLNEAKANSMVTDSERGFKLGLTFQGQSIHEDRPRESFYQRERFYGAAFLRRPVYHWGSLNAASKIGSIQQEISELNLKNISNELSSATRDSYLDLVIMKNRLLLGIDEVQVADNQLKKAQLQRKLEQVNELQVQEVKASLLQRQVQLEDLNRTLLSSISRFCEMTGSDSSQLKLDFNNSTNEIWNRHKFGTNIPQLIGGWSSFNLQKRKKEAEIEAKKIVIAESSLKPKINLVAGVYQDQVPLANIQDNFIRNNVLVGLEVNWDLWDSSKSKGEKLRALAVKRRLEMTLERETRAFRLELENMRSQLSSLSKRIEISKELVSVAENRLQISEIEYASNRMSISQLTDARIALDQARIGRLQSICDYIKIRNRYEIALSVNSE